MNCSKTDGAPSIGLNGCAAEREKRLGIAQNRVFTRTKWLPDVGNLVCATGPAFARLRSNAVSMVKLNSWV